MNLDIKKECNNVMVIVPHQDDEILMSAGVIRVCEQNNVPYTVVIHSGKYDNNIVYVFFAEKQKTSYKT